MKRIHTKMLRRFIGARVGERELLDVLRSRIELLSEEDRAVMALYFDKGVSCYQIAKLAGVSDTTIIRRVRRLSRELVEGEYIRCLKSRGMFSQRELEIARQYFMKKRTMKEIAKLRKLSVYKVRETLFRIRQIIEKEGAGAR